MELDKTFPLKQTTSFIKYIKKLGVNTQRISFLHQFRSLITEVRLTLAYLTMVSADDLLLRKDKMIRCGKEANFKDVFALVVAFILKILNQMNQFVCLHWFESVAEHYHKEQ